MKKKLLMLLLSASMVLSLTPSMAFAEVSDTDVCKIGDKGYVTLDAAIDAASAGDTIILLKDVEGDVTIGATKTIVLELNEKTITGQITNKGSLTVNGTGTITSNKSTIQGYGNLTVNGGNIVSTAASSAAVYVYGYKHGDGNAWAQPVITITGGKLEGYIALYDNQNYYGTTEISGGSLIGSGASYSYYIYSSNPVVSGGIFSHDMSGYCTGAYGTYQNEETYGDSYYHYAQTSETTAVAKLTVDGNDSYYPNVKAATDAVGDGDAGFIKLLKDDKSTFTVDNKNITLDLNGSNIIKSTWDLITVTNGGKLTIQDSKATGTLGEDYQSGMIKNSNSSGADTIYISNGGELIVESGQITTATAKDNKTYPNAIWVGGDTSKLTINGGYIFVPDTDAAQAVAIGVTNSPTITINGGYIKADHNAALSLNGSTPNAPTVTITGGTFKSNKGTAIYKPAAGLMTINGGTFIGYQALTLKGGTTNISGGTFTGTGTKLDPDTPGQSGYTTTGDAIYIEDNYDAAGHTVTLEITGGTFTSENAYSVAARASETEKTGSKISISGGLFDSADGVTTIYGRSDFLGEISVSDGFFSYAPDNKYLAENRKVINNYKSTGVSVEIYPYTIGHTVTFDSASGSQVDAQGVRHDKCVTKPTNPTRSGYVFAGWSYKTGDDAGKQFLFDTKITEDTELIASWIKDENEGKIDVETKDLGVKASSTIKKSDIPMTTTETNAVESGATIDVNLIVKAIEKEDTPKSDKELVEESLEDNQSLGMYLDLSMIKVVTETGKDPVTSEIYETLNKIKVTITIPENLRANGRKYTIVRVHNGVAEKLVENQEADSNWQITFETDKFSTYALVYEGGTAIASTTNTGDSNDIALFGIMGILALAGAGFVYKRREN